MRATLDALHPQVRPLFERFVAECAHVGVPTRVVMTLRTTAEQDALYALGRTRPGRVVTNARSYQSYHVWGVAADIAPTSVLHDPNWSPEAPAWRLMETIAENIGLEHTVKGDLPHFDYREGGHWRRWMEEFPSLILPPDFFKKIP